jgi:type IV fimbrial biogenesis protein FimT
MKKNSGFTLIEIMVTLIIVGILAVVGLPSLSSFTSGGNLVSSSNELVSAIHIARSQAIKLNRKVTICVSSDGAQCLSSNKWQKGWIVFVDANNDRNSTGANCSAKTDINSDCLLRVHEKIDDTRFSVTGIFDHDDSDIKWLTFTSRGLPKDDNASRSGIFSICAYEKSNNNIVGSRAVVLNLPGRVRISENATISCSLP